MVQAMHHNKISRALSGATSALPSVQYGGLDGAGPSQHGGTSHPHAGQQPHAGHPVCPDQEFDVIQHPLYIGKTNPRLRQLMRVMHRPTGLVRQVNANHYVVLISSVSLKTQASAIDSLAGLAHTLTHGTVRLVRDCLLDIFTGCGTAVVAAIKSSKEEKQRKKKEEEQRQAAQAALAAQKRTTLRSMSAVRTTGGTALSSMPPQQASSAAVTAAMTGAAAAAAKPSSSSSLSLTLPAASNTGNAGGGFGGGGVMTAPKPQAMTSASLLESGLPASSAAAAPAIQMSAAAAAMPRVATLANGVAPAAAGRTHAGQVGAGAGFASAGGGGGAGPVAEAAEMPPPLQPLHPHGHDHLHDHQTHSHAHLHQAQALAHTVSAPAGSGLTAGTGPVAVSGGISIGGGGSGTDPLMLSLPPIGGAPASQAEAQTHLMGRSAFTSPLSNPQLPYANTVGDGMNGGGGLGASRGSGGGLGGVGAVSMGDGGGGLVSAAVPEYDANAAAISEVLSDLFADSFVELVPVCWHKDVEKWLWQWHIAMQQLGNTTDALLRARSAAAAEPAKEEAAAAAAAAGLKRQPGHQGGSKPTSASGASAAADAQVAGKQAATPSSSFPSKPTPGTAAAADASTAASGGSTAAAAVDVEVGQSVTVASNGDRGGSSGSTSNESGLHPGSLTLRQLQQPEMAPEQNDPDHMMVPEPADPDHIRLLVDLEGQSVVPMPVTASTSDPLTTKAVSGTTGAATAAAGGNDSSDRGSGPAPLPPLPLPLAEVAVAQQPDSLPDGAAGPVCEGRMILTPSPLTPILSHRSFESQSQPLPASSSMARQASAGTAAATTTSTAAGAGAGVEAVDIGGPRDGKQPLPEAAAASNGTSWSGKVADEGEGGKGDSGNAKGDSSKGDSSSGKGGWLACLSCGAGGKKKKLSKWEKAEALVEQLEKRAKDLAAKVVEMEGKVAEARAEALAKPLQSAYFAIFNSPRDATMLAHYPTLLAPRGMEHGLKLSMKSAPPPEDVDWQALFSTNSLMQKILRTAVTWLINIALFILPMGAATGALTNLQLALCTGDSETNNFYWPWFCEESDKTGPTRLAKSILTGVLPSIIGLLWNGWCMPMLFYLTASINRRCKSLSGKDRQISIWFWWYSTLNVFLGAVLGGGIFAQLGKYLANPTDLLLRIGAGLPSTANFFIQYTIAKTLFSNMLRIVWPNVGMMIVTLFQCILKLLVPRSLHVSAQVHYPPSCRYAGFYNHMMQTFIFGWAFAVVTPLMLPVSVAYFFTAYISMRYCILYIFERNYESGGLMWPVAFTQVMGCLMISNIFTSAVFLASGGPVCAGILFFITLPALVAFWSICMERYHAIAKVPPLTLLSAEPSGPGVCPAAHVYRPPALRPGCLGWYPEVGKVWERYGVPKFVA